MSEITLAPEMTYRVTTTNPLEPTRHAPSGERQYWQVSQATLVGPRINASLAGTGGDWMAIGTDGFWRPDVRVQFLTDDGDVVLMHYTGACPADPRLHRSCFPGPADFLDRPIHAASHRFPHRVGEVRLAQYQSLRRGGPAPGHRKNRIRGAPRGLTGPCWTRDMVKGRLSTYDGPPSGAPFG